MAPRPHSLGGQFQLGDHFRLVATSEGTKRGPDHILAKPGPLDADEWAAMKTHATIGANILAGSSSERLSGTQFDPGLVQAFLPLARALHARWFPREETVPPGPRERALTAP